MKKEAKFWNSIEDNRIQCRLCPHQCKINENKRGICGVRQNENGKLYTLIYGSCSSVAVDPIEKKPFYHLYPGTNAFSLGTVGCTFKCEHCQNYTISTAQPEDVHLEEILPKKAVELAKQYGCKGIAWTYNEPTIWHEYSYDSAKLAKKEGLYTVYVTNGYINEDPLREISPYLDGINIDIKAFNEDFYKKICGGGLEPVLKTCTLTNELGIHLELTYLVLPNYNDSNGEIQRFCNWVKDKLGEDVPLHFSRFHPDYKMRNEQLTPVKTLLNAYEIAKKTGISYVYLGNVPQGEYENTICPNCGNLLVKRYGFSAIIEGLKNDKCSKCGIKIPIIT